MIRIGVVGDIGSGKSHVARLFGCPVFNADREVVKLYRKSKKCYIKLKKALPKYIISFPINKNELAKAIIDSSKNLKKIITVIHPAVRIEMNKFIKKNRKKNFIVLDIPLLMENRINKKDDILIFVQAETKEINKRLIKRPNYSVKIINKLKKLQLPLEFKKKNLIL